jgi:predicted nucleic acid-binding protein
MLHTFIDTNVFLSLYAYTDDNIEELKKVLQLIKSKELKLYISTVVNQEFYRNRDRKIFESLGNLEKFSTSLSIPRFVEHHEEAKQLRKLLKDVEGQRAELVQKAKAEIIGQKLAADQLFLELREAASLLSVPEAVEKAAHKRLERGNPPGKEGSIGDRLNWELLLSKVPDNADLHVVSRDKDFSSPLGPQVPNSFLSGEWTTIKKGQMYLYAGLKPFVKAHFPDIELASDVEKKLAIKALVESGSWQQTHSAIAQLSPFSADLTPDEAKELFDALIANPEIHVISTDSDVHDFYQSLLASHWKVLSTDEYEAVTGHVPDPVPF